MNPPEPLKPATAIPAAPAETQGHHRPTDPDTAPPARAEEPPTAAHVPAPDLPDRIGRYEIRRLLGRGGMGAVYLAHDPELDRPVALKVPRLSGPDAEERFLREARAAAAVSHPNLCPVHDAGRADGVLYLAMAYVPGPTLTQGLRENGPLPPAQAAAVAVAIARGMAEAHRHGIIHRDLKPGNVLLDRRGEPVVTDFGLARRAGTRDAAVDPATTAAHDPRLTQAGVLMGTPAYMPPEQARGEVEKVGPASDVYALGAILFELLTGRPPFQADTIPELVRKIESEPAPAPSAVRAGIPARLDAVVQRALAKDPADRFESMEAFADALAPFAAARRRRWVGVAIAAAFAALAIAAGVVFYIQTDNGTVEVRLNDPSADVQVTIDGNEINLTENGRTTKLRVGPHALEVKGPGFETETRLFKVTRGEKTIMEVELKPKPGVVGPKIESPAGPPVVPRATGIAIAPEPRAVALSAADRGDWPSCSPAAANSFGKGSTAILAPWPKRHFRSIPSPPVPWPCATFRVAVQHDVVGAGRCRGRVETEPGDFPGPIRPGLFERRRRKTRRGHRRLHRRAAAGTDRPVSAGRSGQLLRR